MPNSPGPDVKVNLDLELGKDKVRLAHIHGT